MNTTCTVSKMIIPTYPEPAPERLPMYCVTRCHQRTSGRVYPNPVVKEVVRDRQVDQEYTAITLENAFIRIVVLPELGGRIFEAHDKTNHYDFFYRQHVIKPALIGMLGSWISGGAEFNWPMHHRPSTFLPCDYAIEEAADGSVTAWLSEHEPMERMKGMVGIRLCPDAARFETRVRLFNRTELPRSFLWWENIAVPVNEQYRVFFPQDVNHVYFHGKQSVTGYPFTRRGMFNGKDYRGEPIDIRQHRNTRDATSYFSARSRFDFFGGYDDGKQAGVVHVADHHLSPGKKLFTWAYGQLAESWENALTDSDGPYAELMAGAYSDNQPDFAWIEAGEVKQFCQCWFPIKDINEPLNANTRAALAVSADDGRIRIYAVEAFNGVTVEVARQGEVLFRAQTDLPVAATTVIQADCLTRVPLDELAFRVIADNGSEIISFTRSDPVFPEIPAPRPADPAPDQLDHPDELYLAGMHKLQYRDPLTHPDAYWKRAVEINPEHYQSHLGLGLSALREYRLPEAETCFRKAVAILTRFNPNPRDGEAYYLLGLALKQQGRGDEAYDAFSKAVWNLHWRSQGHYALAQLACARRALADARAHLGEALEACAGNQKARNLLAAVERKLGRESKHIAEETLRMDPLDYWAMNEAGRDFFGMMASNPSQTILDIAFDYTGAGLYEDAVDLLRRFVDRVPEVSPMVWYTLGCILERSGCTAEAAPVFERARTLSPDYCFPSRLEEMQILEDVAAAHDDPRAAYYLGNLLYGRDRHDAAIAQWERALQRGETYYVLYRNLALGRFNNRRDAAGARRLMQQALQLEPRDPQLIFDCNHLLLLAHADVADRLELLEKNPDLLERRDDLYLEWVRAHNQRGDSVRALELLAAHTFTPCEGGEHAVLEQYISAHYRLGRIALRDGDTAGALRHFRDAQVFPENLGAGAWNIALSVPCILREAVCHDRLGDAARAKERFTFLAEMGTDLFSTMYLPSLPCHRAVALQHLGREAEAADLLDACIREWTAAMHRPDDGYFETTPFFLSFLDDPPRIRQAHFAYLLGMAHRAKGDCREAAKSFRKTLALQSGHLQAGLELEMLDQESV